MPTGLGRSNQQNGRTQTEQRSACIGRRTRWGGRGRNLYRLRHHRPVAGEIAAGRGLLRHLKELGCWWAVLSGGKTQDMIRGSLAGGFGEQRQGKSHSTMVMPLATCIVMQDNLNAACATAKLHVMIAIERTENRGDGGTERRGGTRIQQQPKPAREQPERGGMLAEGIAHSRIRFSVTAAQRLSICTMILLFGDQLCDHFKSNA